MMKKIISTVLALAMLAAVLAGCSGTPGTSGGNSDGASAERIEIEYWDITPEGTTGYEELEALVNGFNDTQDKYHITHVGFSFFDYFDKMAAAFAGGVAPDVYLYTMDDVPARAATGTATNLRPYIEADNYDLSDLYERELVAGEYEGDLYALPASATCRLMFYNLDLFEAAGLTEADVPTTWDELNEVAHKMDIVNADGTIAQLGYDPISGPAANYFTLLWQSNLDFFDEEGNPNLTTPEHKEVLDWMANFNSQYSIDQLQAFRDANTALAADSFVTGRLGMMVAVSDEHTVLQNAGVTFRYGAAPMPLPENGKRISWSSCFSFEAFNSDDAERQQGAWEFIKYMLKPESQTAHYNAMGWLTASRTANESLKSDPIMNVIIDELEYASEKRYIEYAPGWHAEWDQFQQKVNTGTPTQDALNEAQKFYEEKQANYAATHK